MWFLCMRDSELNHHELQRICTEELSRRFRCDFANVVRWMNSPCIAPCNKQLRSCNQKWFIGLMTTAEAGIIDQHEYFNITQSGT